MIDKEEKEAIISDIKDLRASIKELEEHAPTDKAKQLIESLGSHILVLEGILKTDEILKGESKVMTCDKNKNKCKCKGCKCPGTKKPAAPKPKPAPAEKPKTDE